MSVIMFCAGFTAPSETQEYRRAWLYLFEPDEYLEGKVFHLDGLDPETRLTREQAENLRDRLNEGLERLSEYENDFHAADALDEYEEARSGKLHTSHGWDPKFPQNSFVYDETGKCLGQLVSVDPEAIRNNPAIQPWSKPAR